MWTLSITQTGFSALSKRQLNREHKLTWLSTGKEWRKRYLRGHFTHAGARKYSYALRAGERRGGSPVPRSYTWTKLKRQSHTRPLEFYGDLKRRALSEEKVTSTRDRVRISMPRKANLLGKYRDELIRVLPREAETLARHWSRTFEGRLARLGKRRTVRV